MSEARVVFIHGVSKPVLEAITSRNPEGFTTIAVAAKTTPEEKQVEAVRDADFILWFSAKLPERVLRSATKARLVQGLSAGYDSIDLKLLRELGIPCANNGGANSWAVADHAVLAMLTLYRRLGAADRATDAGAHRSTAPTPSRWPARWWASWASATSARKSPGACRPSTPPCSITTSSRCRPRASAS